MDNDILSGTRINRLEFSDGDGDDAHRIYFIRDDAMKKIILFLFFLLSSSACFSETMTVRFISVTGAAAYHVFQRGTSQVAVACSTTAYAALALPGAKAPVSGTQGDVWIYSMNGPAFNVGEPVNNDCLIIAGGNAIVVRPATALTPWRRNWVYLDKATYNPVQANATTLSTTVPVPANAVGK
jgi:hypothetical protein